MKAHIGVDCETGIVHSIPATAANVHDVTEAHNLLHGGETVVWGDAGYQGVHKRKENLGLDVDWRVAMRPGKRRGLDPGSDEALLEKAKASVRAKVEHPFLRLKRLFGYGKVRYRGLAKNTQRLALLFGLGNLLTAERTTEGVVRPAAFPAGPPACTKLPEALSGTKRKGLSDGKERPDRGRRPLRCPSDMSRVKKACSEYP